MPPKPERKTELENRSTDDSSPDSRTANRRGPNLLMMLVIAMLLGTMVAYWIGERQSSLSSYSFFEHLMETGKVERVSIGDYTIRGEFKTKVYEEVLNEKGEWVLKKDKEGNTIELEPVFTVDFSGTPEAKEAVRQLANSHNVIFSFDKADKTLYIMYMIMIFLIGGTFVFMWISYRRQRDQMMGGGFLSGFSKSPAKRFDGTQQNVTFDDVAGLEQVKADLQEIVEYLRTPDKFQKLGGRVPKGVLLNGSPGTGKTLLARAVAGEAGVPYYSVNGSEFIQMFVGVGASRVRDLFKTAKENAPAIIFIDEIDAVGRQRGAGLGGGHDEREQTLNQILSEMDGFTQTDSVIILAATNRPDVLDPALLRPGRFDRHVTVGRPTHKGRVEIFKVHVRDVPLAADVDLDVLSSGTVGLTGADIRNIVNEAALWAARHDKSVVEMIDFEHARDKVLMGAKREEVIKPKEKERTAYHEAGHTITAWFLPGADKVHKVTVIPRGRALGVTQTLPEEDRMNLSESEIHDQLVMLMGGRAAEQLVYEETTVGAENDLERATAMARRMVTHWGMSDVLGPVSYKLTDEDPFLGREMHRQREFSEHTMELIDKEVVKILHDASERATQLLAKYRQQLDDLAQGLMDQEELDAEAIAELIGPSVHDRTEKIDAMQSATS